MDESPPTNYVMYWHPEVESVMQFMQAPRIHGQLRCPMGHRAILPGYRYNDVTKFFLYMIDVPQRSLRYRRKIAIMTQKCEMQTRYASKAYITQFL